MSRFRLPCILALSGIVLTIGASALSAAEPNAPPNDPWPGLVQDIFNNRPMSDGGDVIAIEMPYRAEDAAIVPVTLRSKLAPDDSRRLKIITLVIDQNPAPMAAKFEIGPDARVSEISTRVPTYRAVMASSSWRERIAASPLRKTFAALAFSSAGGS